MAAEDPEDPALAFQRARAVVRGGSPIAGSVEAGRIEKLGWLLWSDVDHDVWCDASGLYIRWARDWEATPYLPAGVDSAIHALLQLGGWRGSPGRLRRCLDEEETARRTWGVWKIRRWVWIHDDEDAIRIFVRDVKPDEEQPEVPSPLPVMSRPVAMRAELASARTCRYCGVAQTRYRVLDGLWICPTCGGSFKEEAADLVGVTFREE